MKFEVKNNKIILTIRNKEMEKKNKKFVEHESEMQKNSNPNFTLTDELEIFGQIGKEIIEIEIKKKHELITINDKDLGDLISIRCEPNNEFSIDLIPFDYIWGKILSAGDLYIRTELNKELRNKDK